MPNCFEMDLQDSTSLQMWLKRSQEVQWPMADNVIPLQDCQEFMKLLLHTLEMRLQPSEKEVRVAVIASSRQLPDKSGPLSCAKMADLGPGAAHNYCHACSPGI